MEPQALGTHPVSGSDSVAPTIYSSLRANPLFYVTCAAILALCTVMYWSVFNSFYSSWTQVDTYYSHGFLVPLISLFFVWQKRAILLAEPLRPSGWGYVVVAGSCLMLLAADFLGLRVVAQASVVPMVAGLVLLFFGPRHLAHVWFPVAFLLFMVPIPGSITQSVALRIKLFATESAVRLAQAATLPVIRDGSYVLWGNDRLLVGEVCGGLRSLIALLAFGALMSYISKTRVWARLVILVVAGPVAIIANVARIFGLCVVGYFWGSGVAAGRFHDVSGVLIFVVAFILLFALETLLRKIAPAKKGEA